MTQHIGQLRIGQNIPGVAGVIASAISPVPGKLTGATIKLAGGANPNGAANFRLLIGGVPVGTLVVNPNTVLSTLTLDQPIAQFEEIRIDAPVIPEGGILAPLYLMLTFEDTQGAIKRGDVVYNTPMLANNATNSSVIQLGRGFIAYRIATNVPARVRLYTRQSYRTADLARTYGTLPPFEAGLILDVETAPDNLIIDLNNPVTGANLEDIVTDDIACSITNLSGLNQIVTATITRAIIEGAGASSGFVIEIAEQDGLPDLTANKIIVGNGDLTEISPGVLRLKTAADVVIPPTGIVVQEQDGAPDLTQVLALTVGNGDLTDLGGGVARLKTAADVIIPGSLPPSGAAGGDLGGAYPNPSVSQLRGRSIGGIPLSGGFFADDFNDGITDASLWDVFTGDGADVAPVESGGLLQINKTGAGGSSLGGYTSHASINATNKTITLKLLSADFMGSGGGVRVGVCNPTTNADPQSQSFYGFWVGYNGYYGADGKLSALWYHPSFGFDSHIEGPVWAGATPLWLRLHGNGGTGQWELSYSTDGITFTLFDTWTPHASLTLSNADLHFRIFYGASPAGLPSAPGVARFDDLVSDIAMTDPIAASNGYALVWNQAGNRFELQRIAGVVPSVGATPVGAPSGHVAGFSEVVHDKVNHKIWFWNENTGHWDGVSLPDAS